MEKSDTEEKKKSVWQRIGKGVILLSLIAVGGFFILRLGGCLLVVGVFAWEARPTENKIRAEVRRELPFQKYELEKEPDDYGPWESYKVTVPKEKLTFHGIHAIYDDIWNTGTVKTDYSDMALKKCYDTYPGEKDRIVLHEWESEGLHRVSFSCAYTDLQEMEACMEQARDFGAYVDGLYRRGLYFSWSFNRTVSIDCADGAARTLKQQIWHFDNTDTSYQDRAEMARFLEELDEKLKDYDKKCLYMLSPEREVLYEDGQLIEWETLPGLDSIRPEEGSGYTEQDFEMIPAFLVALPYKSLYALCEKLGMEPEGTPADFSVTRKEEDRTHEYRFSYDFYDEDGFYYMKDGEKVYEAVLFCIDSRRASEILGITLHY